jgi:hypothetical protein
MSIELEAYKLALENVIRERKNLIPLTKQRVCKGGPGTWCFQCEGCGHMHCYYTVEAGRPIAWQFNGSLEFPTFTPSLLNRWGKYADPNWVEPTDVGPDTSGWSGICHIFVTNGQVQFLGDCTHKLAGVTQMLPYLREDTVENYAK